MVPSDPFMSHLATQLGYSAGNFRLCNWLSLRRLVSWINHLPPACWSTFWKAIFKQQFGCRLDKIDSISHFLIYAIIYVLIHHIIFWRYLYFLNIYFYFFKYCGTNIFHRRSSCTFYRMSYLLGTDLDRLSTRQQLDSTKINHGRFSHVSNVSPQGSIHCMNCNTQNRGLYGIWFSKYLRGWFTSWMFKLRQDKYELYQYQE